MPDETRIDGVAKNVALGEDRPSPSGHRDARRAPPASLSLIAMASAPSISDAVRTTLDLFQAGVDLMRQNLRRRCPDAHEHEIDRLLQEWLLERPGAEAGDCPGRPIDVKSRLA